MLDSTPIDAAFVGVGEKKLKEESFSSRKNHYRLGFLAFPASLTSYFFVIFLPQQSKS